MLQRLNCMQLNGHAFRLLVVAVVWFSTGLLLVWQLTPIPHSMVVGAPSYLQCDFYVSGKFGWSCSRWKDFFSQPWPSLIALSISYLCFAWIIRPLYFFSGAPVVMLFAALQLFPFFAVAVLIRFASFTAGSASIEYAMWTIAPFGVACACFLALTIRSKSEQGRAN